MNIFSLIIILLFGCFHYLTLANTVAADDLKERYRQQSFLGIIPQPPPPQQPQAQAVNVPSSSQFAANDKANNGNTNTTTLTLDKVLAVMAFFNRTFEQMDNNGDGLVSPDEYVAANRQHQQGAAAMPNSTTLLKQQEENERRWVNQADTNSDGFLERNEFVAAMMKMGMGQHWN